MRKENRKSEFYTRGFTTFLLTTTFLLIAVTGTVLFVTPRGRVANWTDWTVLGLGKDQWGAVHMTAATLFLIVAALHLFFNWKVILGYLRLKRVAGIRLKRELAAALVVALLVVAGTLGQVPPFGTLLDVHHQIKNAWEPAIHSGAWLEAYGERNRRPIGQAVGACEEQEREKNFLGRNVSRIAEADPAAPGEFHRGSPTGPVSGERIGGRGRMTLGELCSAEGLSYDAVAALLRERGIQATPSTPLRELAASMDMRPGQFLSTLIPTGSGTFVESEPFQCSSPSAGVQSLR